MGNEIAMIPDPIVDNRDWILPAIQKNAREAESYIQRDLDINGPYTHYRRTRMLRDVICHHPFIAFSGTLRQDCFEAQMSTLKAQLRAMEETEGRSIVMDLFEK